MRRAAGAALLALVLVVCAAFCLTRLSEVDFHWHLLAGQRILAEHRVPRSDSFSFASAGRAWTDLHWMFELLVAWVWARAGWTGLDLLKVAFITGGFACALVSALRRGASAPVAAVVGLLAVVAGQERFNLRPEAASFLLLGVLLLLLERRRDHPRVVALAPPLMAIWANLHALFAVGLAALALVAVGDHLERRLRPEGRAPAEARPRPRLFLAAVASLAATLLTPYGVRGWVLPLRLLFQRIGGDNVYSRSIAEFQAPFGGFGWTSSVQAFALLALITAPALVRARRDLHLSEALLLVAFFALALLARRNIALFALVALAVGTPLIAAALRSLSGGRRAAPSSDDGAGGAPAWIASGLAAAAGLALLAAVCTDRFYARDGTQRYFGRGEAPGFYPAGAADFVLARSLPGETMHDMTVGGFLAWRWFPGRRVFLDGRLEVHDPEVYAAYLKSLSDPEAFEDLARRFRIGVVVWSHRQSAEAAPLLRHLASGHGWKPVFVDLAAAVFVRDIAGGAAGAPPQAIDLGEPMLARRLLDQIAAADLASASLDPLPLFLRALLPWREVPVAEVNTALFFAVIGQDGAAEELFRAALARAPLNPVLHYDLALVLEHAGKNSAARAACERALALDPSFAAAHAALARQALAQGDAGAALAEWAAAERLAPLDGAALQARGALLARRGQLDEAIEDYRQVVRSEPHRMAPRLDLAFLYQRRGLREQALAEIGRAAALDPRSAGPRVALARLRAAEGDLAGAEKALRAILAEQPRSAEAHLALALLLVGSLRHDEAMRELEAAVGAGTDPGVLSGEPALRVLAGRPDFVRLLRRTGP